MSLPDDVILLLRDEAYLDLCRTALSEANERLVAEKDQVAQTRPPFGLLATKKQKEAFEASMQNLLNNKAGIAEACLRYSRSRSWMAFFSHFSIASSLPSLAAIPALLFSRFCIDASKASFCFLVARSPNGGRVCAT